MEKKVLKLSEPIKFGEETVHELHFRKPKARDLKVMKGKGGVGDVLALAAQLCDQPPSMIDELCIDDTMEVVEIVGNFMGAGRRTGEKSSD